MIPTTTETEAREMTACPACGAHKGAGPRVCNACLYSRTDIVPLFCSGCSFDDWLEYALGGLQVLEVAQSALIEPQDLVA